MPKKEMFKGEQSALRVHGGPITHIFEAAVKDLKLLAGEPCPSLELLQSLGAMANRRQLELIFNAVWRSGEKPGVSKCWCFFYPRHFGMNW